MSAVAPTARPPRLSRVHVHERDQRWPEPRDVNDDPNASAGNTALVTTLEVAFALLALFLYRGLMGSRDR